MWPFGSSSGCARLSGMAPGWLTPYSFANFLSTTNTGTRSRIGPFTGLSIVSAPSPGSSTPFCDATRSAA